VNRQFATALGVATSAIVGAAVISMSVASAATPAPTTNEQAIAQLEIAKTAINNAEALLAPATTAPPTTTTAPPTTTTEAPPTTTPAPPTDDQSAGTKLNWGAPNPQFSDEFNTVGSPDPAKWNNAPVGCFAGNGGNGKRCGGNTAVVPGGFLRETGLANGNTGWMESKKDQKYGKWEVRMKISAPAGTGAKYHPVLILWTDALDFPKGGEVDYTEVNIGDTHDTAFIHHPTSSGTVQDQYTSATMDLTQWHDYAVEWTPTAINGYIDGVKWFSDSKPGSQPPVAMHQTIQLDNNDGTHEMPATMDVDWFHLYS
jgi:beta-glucanase (GH16 family)